MTEKSTKPYALVCDDDAMILMDASQILRNAGFRTLEAMDAKEAQNLMAKNAPSVILLFSDVDLGDGEDGFFLARWTAERFVNVEIVIASGASFPVDGDMPYRATFIRKPFNAKMVREHLAKTLPDHKKPEPLLQAV